MDHEVYVSQVRLLVRLLPIIAKETVFALKGGTAINLFYRDLPRLSVDIDLTYIPVEDRPTSLIGIDEAMSRIRVAVGALPGVTTKRISGGGGGETRVEARKGNVAVKIETSPVTRGVVFPCDIKRTSQTVEAKFGFAEMRVVSFEDLYGGKLHAALDRQHPRDLFDAKLLYDNEGMSHDLFRAFLVYVASSPRPVHEVLDPNQIDISDRYEQEFVGLTTEPIKLATLIGVRVKLIDDIQSRLIGSVAEFLRSLQSGEPAFDLIGLPEAENLPAVKWKVLNLKKLIKNNPGKYAEQSDALFALLGN